MIPAGSRYELAERAFVSTHVYNEFGYTLLEGDNPNLKVRVVSREASFIPAGNDPVPPDRTMEYYVKDTEDFSWLAYKFMGDSTKWNEIATINPEIWYPLDAAMGDYIRVSGPVTR